MIRTGAHNGYHCHSTFWRIRATSAHPGAGTHTGMDNMPGAAVVDHSSGEKPMAIAAEQNIPCPAALYRLLCVLEYCGPELSASQNIRIRSIEVVPSNRAHAGVRSAFLVGARSDRLVFTAAPSFLVTAGAIVQAAFILLAVWARRHL